MARAKAGWFNDESGLDCGGEGDGVAVLWGDGVRGEGAVRFYRGYGVV